MLMSRSLPGVGSSSDEGYSPTFHLGSKSAWHRQSVSRPPIACCTPHYSTPKPVSFGGFGGGFTPWENLVITLITSISSENLLPEALGLVIPYPDSPFSYSSQAPHPRRWRRWCLFCRKTQWSEVHISCPLKREPDLQPLLGSSHRPGTGSSFLGSPHKWGLP